MSCYRLAESHTTQQLCGGCARAGGGVAVGSGRSQPRSPRQRRIGLRYWTDAQHALPVTVPPAPGTPAKRSGFSFHQALRMDIAIAASMMPPCAAAAHTVKARVAMTCGVVVCTAADRRSTYLQHGNMLSARSATVCSPGRMKYNLLHARDIRARQTTCRYAAQRQHTCIYLLSMSPLILCRS
jgi:hypothetical protein